MPVWAYLVAIPVFGLLVVVHEAGHYLAARKNGIAVAEFAVGFGPRLFGFTRGGTEWNLRLLPLGGYVRWQEAGPQAFAAAPAGARLGTLLAGPLANLVLTVLLLTVLYGPVQGGSWEAAWAALQATCDMAAMWLNSLAGLFGSGAEELAGPVGIAQMTAEMVVAGADDTLLFAAFLSLNLALFNLLPIPGLDGGRVIFVTLERIRGGPLDPGIEGWIHAGGFLGILALVFYTTVKDMLV